MLISPRRRRSWLNTRYDGATTKRSNSCVKAEDAARDVEGRQDSVHDLRLRTLGAGRPLLPAYALVGVGPAIPTTSCHRIDTGASNVEQTTVRASLLPSSTRTTTARHHVAAGHFELIAGGNALLERNRECRTAW